VIVVYVSHKILDEEQRLEVGDPHGGGRRLRGIFRDQVEHLFMRIKVGDEPLQNTPILIVDDDFVLSHQIAS
jgi:hypothetical protein